MDDVSFVVGMVFGGFMYHFVFVKIILKPRVQKLLMRFKDEKKEDEKKEDG